MDKKLKTAKGLLNWFVDLINTDLEELSDSKLHELWDRIRDIAYGNLGYFIIKDEDIIKWEVSTKRLGDIQKDLKSLLERILKIRDKKPKTRLKLVKDFERREKAIEEYGDGMVGLLESASDEKVPKWVQEHMALEYSPRIRVLVRDKIVTYVPKFEDRVMEKFLNALAEFPLSSIKRCEREDCSKYFLEATKRKKRYCSEKCAWVIVSRERRAGKR